MKRILIPAIALLTGTVAGYIISSTGSGLRHDPAVMCMPVPVSITETITVRDTLRLRIPIPTGRMDSSRTVTIPTQWVTAHRDSDSLTVQAETRVYSCSTFRAVVSGVRPSLDSLTLYRTSPVITHTIAVPQPVSRWGIGVTAGMTATSRGLAPGVTVGVTYRLWPK
ncbi:MAG: hypothetical protein NC349_08375 [Paenibacillus sp.]|nr:hypothetical protein [Paenibacillus sp.]